MADVIYIYINEGLLQVINILQWRRFRFIKIDAFLLASLTRFPFQFMYTIYNF